MDVDNLAPGDQITVSKCTSSDCTSTTVLKIFTSDDAIYQMRIVSVTETNPVVQVVFQGGSTGIVSTFLMSFTTKATVYCAEKDCSTHCTAKTAAACDALTSCYVRNSDPTATMVNCLCTWQYSGNVPAGSISSQQPDYQTNGSCGDLGGVIGAVIAATFAFAGGLLVIRARFPMSKPP